MKLEVVCLCALAVGFEGFKEFKSDRLGSILERHVKVQLEVLRVDGLLEAVFVGLRAYQ